MTTQEFCDRLEDEGNRGLPIHETCYGSGDMYHALDILEQPYKDDEWWVNFRDEIGDQINHTMRFISIMRAHYAGRHVRSQA